MENRRTRMTKRLIAEGLLELLQDKPLDKVTIKEICAQADVNRSTFYDHYADVDALLRDMEAEFVSRIPRDYASEGIETQLISFIRYVKENGRLYTAMRKYGDLVSERLIQTILTNYIDEMAIPADVDRGFIEMCVIYVVNGTCSIIDEWMKRDYYCTPEQMTEIVMRLAYSVFNPSRVRLTRQEGSEI